MSDAPIPFEPANRRLCPDGSCLGLVGPDGQCNICGARGEPGALPSDASGGGDDRLDLASAPPGDERHTSGTPAGDFDPNRRLCEDGSCTGVIGADGACNVCGRRAAQSS